MRKLLSPEKQETEMKCYVRPPVVQKMSDNPIQWIKNSINWIALLVSLIPVTYGSDMDVIYSVRGLRI